MACVLTKTRGVECNDSIGGLALIEFATYGTLGTPTYDITDTDVITAFSGTGITWLAYDLNSNLNTFVETINTNKDNGTTYYNQVLTLSLKRLDAATTREVKLMCYGLNHVRITDRNGNVFLMGLEKGASVTGGTQGTGGNLGDFSGYSLTLTADEKNPANFFIPV